MTMKCLKVYSALALTLLFWASAFVGIRISLTDYSPGALGLLRFLVASLCMAVVYYYLPNKRPIPWSIRLQLLMIGMLCLGVYHTCLNIGEVNVSAGVASFIIGLMPVITLIICMFLRQERSSVRIWTGIFVSFIGLVLMVVGEKTDVTFNMGLALIFISAVMGSIYSVTQKHYLRDYHPVVITTWIIWGGTLVFLGFISDLSREFVTASTAGTLAAIYMGIFPAALAYMAWCYVLNHLPAAKASMYLYFLPVLSTLLGLLILHEKPSSLSLIGGGVALMGALIATRINKKNQIA